MAPTENASPHASRQDEQVASRPKALPAETPAISIRQFESQDLDAVLTLFKDGMMLYTEASHPHYQVWVNYVSNSLATDLADIHGFYLREGSNFFVATMKDAATGDSVVIGTIAIERKTDELAELRRVSVKADCRRFGIGRLLMSHAAQWGKQQHQYARLTLSTAATQHLAIKFYESLGYRFTKTSVLCNDPQVRSLALVRFKLPSSHPASPIHSRNLGTHPNDALLSAGRQRVVRKWRALAWFRVGELRRVSVKLEYRRFGVGVLLINHMEQWAKANGFTTLTLSNGNMMTGVHKFYYRLGYKYTVTTVLCPDPLYEVFNFEKHM